MRIESFTVFRLTADIRYRNVSGEGIVVRQAGSEVLMLSDVGTRVLEMVVARKPVSAMVLALGREYEVGLATLEVDVRAYLSSLVEAGIVEPINCTVSDVARAIDDGAASEHQGKEGPAMALPGKGG